MARTTARPCPPAPRTRQPLGRHGPRCGETRWAASHHYRTSTTLADVVPLTRHSRRGLKRACPPFPRPSRPAAAGRLALPQPALGLEVRADVGPLRAAPPRRRPAIPPPWRSRGVAMAPRPVLPRLARAAALRTLSLTATARRQRRTPAQGRGLLARAGLPPAVGPEGRWGLRDGLAGAGLLARRWWSAPPPALAVLLRTVRPKVPGPMVGLGSAGPRSLRGAVAAVGAAGPPHRGPCPDLREAVQPL